MPKRRRVETTTGPWSLGAGKHDPDQRRIEADVELMVNWDLIDARIRGVISSAINSKRTGHSGRASWLAGAVVARVKSVRRLDTVQETC
jgi:hypothetical protein